MRLTSWLSSWTRWLAAPGLGRNVRERHRSRSYRMADIARVTAPLERLEARLVLDGTLANDLAAFARQLRDNGVTLYGAGGVEEIVAELEGLAERSAVGGEGRLDVHRRTRERRADRERTLDAVRPRLEPCDAEREIGRAHV